MNDKDRYCGTCGKTDYSWGLDDHDECATCSAHRYAADQRAHGGKTCITCRQPLGEGDPPKECWSCEKDRYKKQVNEAFDGAPADATQSEIVHRLRVKLGQAGPAFAPRPGSHQHNDNCADQIRKYGVCAAEDPLLSREPTPEEMEYVYKSLGVPNPNK